MQFLESVQVLVLAGFIFLPIWASLYICPFIAAYMQLSFVTPYSIFNNDFMFL